MFYSRGNAGNKVWALLEYTDLGNNVSMCLKISPSIKLKKKNLCTPVHFGLKRQFLPLTLYHPVQWCIGFFCFGHIFGSVCHIRVVRMFRGEPSQLEPGTRLTLKAIVPVNVFILFYFLGEGGHNCTDSILEDYSTGLCFSRANADLRYIQSETPSTLQPQSLCDFYLL